MIRYFLRQYWRYIAMALALATVSYLLGACEVKAETSIQSENLNYNHTIPASSGVDFQIFSSSNTLKNYGRGILQFTVMTYSFSSNTSHLNNSIAEVTVTSTGSVFTCNIGNAVNNYDQETNYDVNLYSVMCDVNLGSSGLQRIDVKMVYNLSNSYTLRTSQFMTFVGDVDLSIYSSINQVNSTLSTYLQSIYNNITSTNNHLASLENIVNTDLTTIMNLLSTNLSAINNKLNELLEQNKVCDIYDKNDIETDGKALDYQTGTELINNAYGITKYIKIDKNSKISIFNSSTGILAGICFYNINKIKISCLNLNNLNINENIIIPTNSSYVRSTIYKAENRPQLQICKNGNQALADNQNQINSNITDSSTDDPSSDITDMSSDISSNTVISDLLLLPVSLFQNILNSINGTCSSFNLGSLFGTNLILPCIDIENIIGSSLWGIIDVLFCGIFVLSMRKKFVDIFQNITSLSDRGNELE